MQEKYADQDEEERQLRMEILAVGICVIAEYHMAAIVCKRLLKFECEGTNSVC